MTLRRSQPSSELTTARLPQDMDLTVSETAGGGGRCHIVIIEDDPLDAELAERDIHAGGIDASFSVVSTAEDFLRTLALRTPDLVLADYSLPAFSGPAALAILRESCPDVPLIILSGAIADDRAVELLRQGAADYVLKDRRARLAAAIKRALAEAAEQRENRKLDEQRAEAERRASAAQARLASIFEVLGEGIIVQSDDGTIELANRTAADILGLGVPELIGSAPDDPRLAAVHEDGTLFPGEDHPAIITLRTGEPQRRVTMGLRRPSGERLWIAVNTERLPDDGSVVSSFRDITKEQANHQALRTLSAVERVVVHGTRADSLLQDACAAIVGAGGYPHVWVAAADPEGPAGVAVVAQAGRCAPQLSRLVEAQPGAAGPVLDAIVTGEVRVVDDIGSLPDDVLWRQRVLDRGHRSLIALPLRAQGHIFGALAIFADDPHAFGEGAEPYLRALAADLGIGLDVLRLRGDAERHARRLNDVLTSAVEAVAAVNERRDAYTAGHQHRVARLSDAIARQLGMGEDERRGIVLAASIHDIGKIAVPAEILTKPTRLGAFEWGIIKEHPQVGSDILAGVDFPWPVSDMIRQHHERLDGSGYPDGLVGEDIGPGARIIAVADVVEAMASHRPYRPALGIDAALGHVAEEAGRTLDERAVSACTTIFQSGFGFAA